MPSSIAWSASAMRNLRSVIGLTIDEEIKENGPELRLLCWNDYAIPLLTRRGFLAGLTMTHTRY
jgi:hypothetical protein